MKNNKQIQKRGANVRRGITNQKTNYEIFNSRTVGKIIIAVSTVVLIVSVILFIKGITRKPVIVIKK